MKIKVKRSQLAGEICIPGSKSHTIRALAVAAMADGTSEIRGPLISGDTMSCAKAARSFGAEVKQEDGLWTVKGVAGKLRKPEKTIDMENSGTSLRIFTGIAALADFKVEFDGDSSLRTRPMAPLLDALQLLGVETSSKNGKCPVSVKGPLKGGKTDVVGKSSQFLTSLLFACPIAPADTEINVINLNEKPYVEITLDWLKRQNIKFDYKEDMSCFRIKGGQAYTPFNWTIPADFSTATFPLVAAAVTGGCIAIKNLDFTDRQGDKEIFKHLERMGVSVQKSEVWTKVKGTGKLQGQEFDLNATPDALPAMAVAGALSSGTTKLLNVPQARIKETDRIACMTKELRKMGAEITELEDGMIIKGGKLHGAELESYDDHRIVMSLAIAAMAADGETVINNAEAAAVTYPDFIKDFQKIGANIEIL